MTKEKETFGEAYDRGFKNGVNSVYSQKQLTEFIQNHESALETNRVLVKRLAECSRTMALPEG
jgi:hypothetical protein